MAIVGKVSFLGCLYTRTMLTRLKPLVDIDIQSQISPEDEAVITPPAQQAGSPSDAQQPQKALEQAFQQTTDNSPLQDVAASSAAALRKHATLATPAVRHLTKELKVDLADVPGTGKEGRVLKEDVHKFARGRDQPDTRPESSAPPTDQVLQTESSISLTPIQAQMFKTMTQSLGIPHFLYSDEVNLDALTSLRKRLTKHLPASSSEPLPKLTYMPFIIKAVSLALNDYPLLNARVEAASDGSKPRLMMRAQHNIGVAMATPQGLLVPNIKHVASLSIPAIAARLAALQALASAGKLSSADLSGGTITVSNIGNVGGTVVAPVLVSSEVAILGVGRARTTPAFDEHDNLVKRLVGHFSWSADHRVVDGAMMASMADRVRCLVEEPDAMLAALR